MDHFHTLGNMDLLKLHKTAFLCSRKCPAAVVLKAYDWAITKRKGNLHHLRFSFPDRKGRPSLPAEGDTTDHRCPGQRDEKNH